MAQRPPFRQKGLGLDWVQHLDRSDSSAVRRGAGPDPQSSILHALVTPHELLVHTVDSNESLYEIKGCNGDTFKRGGGPE